MEQKMDRQKEKRGKREQKEKRWAFAGDILKVAFFLIAIGFLVYLSFFKPSSSQPINESINGTYNLLLESTARCLTDNGVTLYAVETCPNCKYQKILFGDAIQYIDIIDCAEQPDLCSKEDIQLVPTWIFANGTKLVGAYAPLSLGEMVGCSQ